MMIGLELTNPDQTLNRLDQLLGIVTDAVLENDLDILDVEDARRRVAFHDHQVRCLADCDRADPSRQDRIKLSCACYVSALG